MAVLEWTVVTPPGMAGIPGLQQRQCGAIADFANDDAVRTEAHGALEQPRRDRMSLVCRHTHCLPHRLQYLQE